MRFAQAFQPGRRNALGKPKKSRRTFAATANYRMISQKMPASATNAKVNSTVRR